MWVPGLLTSTFTHSAILQAQRQDLLLSPELTHWLGGLTNELQQSDCPHHSPVLEFQMPTVPPSFLLVLKINTQVLTITWQVLYQLSHLPSHRKEKLLTMILMVIRNHLNGYRNQVSQNNTVLPDHVFTTAKQYMNITIPCKYY